MNIEAKKLELIQWLASVEDEDVIARLELVRDTETETGDWFEELPEDVKESILRGEDDAKNGRVIPHEEVKKLYEKWL